MGLLWSLFPNRKLLVATLGTGAVKIAPGSVTQER